MAGAGVKAVAMAVLTVAGIACKLATSLVRSTPLEAAAFWIATITGASAVSTAVSIWAGRAAIAASSWAWVVIIMCSSLSLMDLRMATTARSNSRPTWL